MDPTNAGTSADAPRSPSGDGGATAVGPDGGPTLDPLARSSVRRGRWLLPTVLVPVVVLVVLVIAWAVDTSSGGVARNVHLAGMDVSHLSETQLAAKVATLAKAYATVPVDDRRPAGLGRRADPHLPHHRRRCRADDRPGPHRAAGAGTWATSRSSCSDPCRG